MSVKFRGPTLEKMAPATARKGVTPRRTRASLQSRMKPIANAAKKVVTHWIKMAKLSPIPAWIWSKSLEWR